MPIRIEKLSEKNEQEYKEWLLSLDTSLLYASLNYRNFLSHILEKSESIYLLAYMQDRLVGALPTFIKLNNRFGYVLNSLPFFGSNGGIITNSQIKNRKSINLALMEAYFSIAKYYRVVVSTLISNPLDPMIDFYETYTLYTYRDERIGQITKLLMKLQRNILENLEKKILIHWCLVVLTIQSLLM